MKLNKGDIIKDGENFYSVFCALMGVVYVEENLKVDKDFCYELKNVLKHYRKIEIIQNNRNDGGNNL